MPQSLKINLADRTANEIIRLIGQGHWRDSLPGERHLAQELGVGRSTLRAALGQLQKKGHVRICQGRATQLLQPDLTTQQRSIKRVAFLTPLPPGKFFTNPDYPLWYEALVIELRRRGYELELLHLPPSTGQTLERKLALLLKRYAMDAWLLHQTAPMLQAWFSRHEIPAMVVGSSHTGMNLVGYDIDNRAVCHHAMHTLFRLGHRRIAFFVPDSGRAGDILSEEGYLQATREMPGADVLLFRYADNLKIRRKVLERIFKITPEITGLIVANAIDVPLAMVVAAEIQRPCPEGISIISRTDHSCLKRILPEPSYYRIDEKDFAGGMSRVVDALVARSRTKGQSIFVLPDYVEGKSVMPLKK